MEMSARAIGADQHQRADRVAGGALDVGGGKLDALRLRLRLDLGAESFADFGPVAVERRDEFVALGRRPVGPSPGRPARVLGYVAGIVLQALEERLPLGVDRLRIGLVARIEVFDIRGIAAVEERGEGEGGVRVLARHGKSRAEGCTNRQKARRVRKTTKSARPGAGDFSCTLFNGLRCGKPKDVRSELRFQYFGEGLAEPRRRRRDLDAGRFHGGDLGFRAALAAGDDGAGMAHAPAGRRGAAGDEADHRLLAAALGFVLENCAASSSDEPPISPIMTIDSVAVSARNISSTSMKSVPLTGSPPMPTAVVWPRPSCVVWNTAS